MYCYISTSAFITLTCTVHTAWSPAAQKQALGEPVLTHTLGCFKKNPNCCLMSHFLAFKKGKYTTYTARIRLEGLDCDKHCKWTSSKSSETTQMLLYEVKTLKHGLFCITGSCHHGPDYQCYTWRKASFLRKDTLPQCSSRQPCCIYLLQKVSSEHTRFGGQVSSH